MRRVIDCVAHRGPDDAGEAVFSTPHGPLTLLHRRLAIFDLDDRATQPMSNADGSCTLIFNGAIYNFVELRSELARHGNIFKTSSDSEVLLAAYRTWGADCLRRFNGMFAVIIYDQKNNKVFVARDRFGIKPLYFWVENSKIALASEIKQILCLPDVYPRCNKDALHDFIVHGLTDHSNATCFANINPVPPGHYLEINLNAPLPSSVANVSFTRWFQLPQASQTPVSADQAVADFRQLLNSSVSLRQRGDVTKGSCLSGGLDSSAIVGNMAMQNATNSQHVISAVYPGLQIDESRFVDAVAGKFPQLTVHKVVPDARGAIKELEQLVWHQDEPFGSMSIFVQWSVMAEARRRGLTVMLDGQGADELFGGYYQFFGHYLADLARRGHLLELLKTSAGLRRKHRYGIFQQAMWLALAVVSPSLVERIRGLAGRNQMVEWLKDPNLKLRLPLRDLDLQNRRTSELDAMHRQAVVASSLPMLLRFEDRNSMAHGIEARVPFLDHRIVEAAIRLGGRYDIQNGETKWLIRQAAADLLPKSVRNRRDKIGFSAPEAIWMKNEFAKHVPGWADDAIELLPDTFRNDRLRRQGRAMIDGERPYDNALWRICSLGLWARKFAVR